ncbi:MAG TPA: DUF2203 domain-containing protein [Bacillota bacterium]|nr:DUF2203 domain-containing protein [Bacillota bacterium]
MKTFTVTEANALIPQLSALLPAVRAAAARCQDLTLECERLKEVGVTDDGVLIMAADYRAARAALLQARAQFDSGLQQVAAIGCQLKGLEPPLVDFPGEIGGQPVLFCWRLGEPAVTHYHGYDDGFAGRRPIPNP